MSPGCDMLSLHVLLVYIMMLYMRIVNDNKYLYVFVKKKAFAFILRKVCYFEQVDIN